MESDRNLNLNDVKKTDPELFEQLYIHETYSKVANHFSKTRYRGWPKVVTFVQEHTKNEGTILLDFGCGNCKYYNSVPATAYYIAIDACFNLLTEADNKLKLSKEQKSHYCLIQSNILNIPLKETTGDVGICIATLHHLCTVERRQNALREMIRTLKPNSKLLVYLWAFEQKDGSIGVRKFDMSESFVPWKNQQDNITYKRFYKIFKKEEIYNEFQDALSDIAYISEVYYDINNWAVVFVKR